MKLCHCSCSETIAPQVFGNYGTAHWFYRTVRCHSFWTPAVVLNRCAVLLDHNNARFSCKYRTARAGLNFAHKKCEVCMFFAQSGCLTINTLLRGPNIIIWSHVLCPVHHPFNLGSTLGIMVIWFRQVDEFRRVQDSDPVTADSLYSYSGLLKPHFPHREVHQLPKTNVLNIALLIFCNLKKHKNYFN